MRQRHARGWLLRWCWCSSCGGAAPMLPWCGSGGAGVASRTWRKGRLQQRRLHSTPSSTRRPRGDSVHPRAPGVQLTATHGGVAHIFLRHPIPYLWKLGSLLLKNKSKVCTSKMILSDRG
nr:uncharacterized protein LOC127299509 [Lolium perenne]